MVRPDEIRELDVRREAPEEVGAQRDQDERAALRVPRGVDERVHERTPLVLARPTARTAPRTGRRRARAARRGGTRSSAPTRSAADRSPGRTSTHSRPSAGSRPARRSDDLPLPDGPTSASSGASASRADELVDEPLAAEEELRVRRLERREALERTDVAKRLAARSRARRRRCSAPGPGRGSPVRAAAARPRARARARRPGASASAGRPRGPPPAGRSGRARASAARGSARGTGARRPSASSSETSARWRPSASSASIRSSTAASRSSSSRSASTRASRSNSRSASGRPCHSASGRAQRRRRRGGVAGRERLAARPRRAARSSRGRARPARRAGGSRRARAARRGSSAAAALSTFRSRETWLRSAWSAEFTLCSAKSSPISRSRETTRFALSSSSASSARCFGPPAGTATPSDPHRERAEDPELEAARCHRADSLTSPATPLPRAGTRLGTALGHRSRDARWRALHGQVLLARRHRGRASARGRAAGDEPGSGPQTVLRGALVPPAATSSSSACSSRASREGVKRASERAGHPVRARDRDRLGRARDGRENDARGKLIAVRGLPGARSSGSRCLRSRRLRGELPTLAAGAPRPRLRTHAAAAACTTSGRRR